MSRAMSVLWVLGRLLYRAVLLVLWLLLLIYLVFKMSERSDAIDSLPAQLEVDGVVLIGSESGIREGCGVAVLRMSPTLRTRLLREGLGVLHDARQARGYTSAYHHFAPWQPTPTAGDEDEAISPIFLGLQCVDADEELAARIGEAARAKGGYYSTKPEGALLLLPREGLIVLGYFG